MAAPSPSQPQPSSSGQAQANQAAIASAAAALVAQAFTDLDVHRLTQTLPLFKRDIAAIVTRYGQAAAAAALQFYRQQRLDAGITAPLRLKPAPTTPLGQVGQAVDYATSPLWGEPDVALSQDRLEAVVERLVLNAGRDTIVQAVHEDREAKGWARIPEPGACYFCAMLATRGAVYKKDTADFQAHDHCRCHAEPVFTAYEPSAQVREWDALYRQATRGVHGMKNQQRAFRRAYDARTTETPEPAPTRVRTLDPRHVNAAIDQLEAQIAAMQRSDASPQVIAAARRRLTELRAAA